MDSALGQLGNCRKLSLSTNSIEKIMNLGQLRNLEILSLGRNAIKKITGLDEVGATLRELWISYNLIERLDGLQSCLRLQVLFISNNRVRSWDEVGRLVRPTQSQLPELKNLLMLGNPIYEGMSKDEVKPLVVQRVPQLETLDGLIITNAVRHAAEEAKTN
jgi:dynein light chain 1